MPDQLGPIVQTHKAGQPVRLEVVRNTTASACPTPTKTLTLDVPVVQNPQNTSTRIIGVSVEPHFVLPVDVCINAGNIGDRLEMTKALLQIGVNVFVFDYRGFGRSLGHPSEEGTYLDAVGGGRVTYLDGSSSRTGIYGDSTA